MKKIFLSVVAVFLGFIAVGQDVVVWEDAANKLKYTQIGSTNNVSVQQLGGGQQGMPTGYLEIPSQISRNSTVYTVTEIASYGFSGLNDLSEVTIPNTVTKIGDNAFMSSGGNAHPFVINMSENIKEIGASAFECCNNLSSITLHEGLKKIGDRAFAQINGITEIILPSTLETLGSSAFVASNNLETVVFNSWPSIEADAFQGCNHLDITGPCGLSLSDIGISSNSGVTITIDTSNCMGITKENGNFNNEATWGVNSMSVLAGKDRKIQSIHTVTIPDGCSLDISGSNPKLTNNGTLVLKQGGQLVGVPEGSGTIEVETPDFYDRAWYFVGAPFANYGFDVIKFHSTTDDAVVSLFNHSTAQWRVDYTEIYEETVAAGEGFLVWPFTAATANEPGPEPVVFTNRGNYSLNNSDVTVTKTLHEGNEGNGHWMALANPYTFKLNIATFLDDQPGNTIQGGVFYRFNGIYWTIANEGEINVTEGFFVNFTSGGEKTANFKITQRYVPVPSAKVSEAREFIRLSMADGESNIELLFAHNEDTEQGYDIYDANKMFATTGVSEPYFVTEGIALVKEEVKELPYYATMNVRSSESKEVKFKADYIPEGLAVSIIDGEEVIDLTEGVEYATEIASGENADRFKVLVKKNVGLADVEDLDVRIINSNRHITITAQEDVKVTVYNTLGQRVFETEKTDFVLSGVVSGAYVVKVQGAKAAKSQKIVVE
ncbi:MAG: leucine-rich repeat domain-containing protein [Bacteroidales bacterium]|nr:leucine-rich repeat domain-containing protein [Bacteroidales bacterium]